MYQNKQILNQGQVVLKMQRINLPNITLSNLNVKTLTVIALFFVLIVLSVVFSEQIFMAINNIIYQIVLFIYDLSGVVYQLFTGDV